MKIIEAMKKIKELQEKADDYRKKVYNHHADLSHETPVYGAEQQKQVREWIQGHSDILKEILRLRVAIQKTNIVTHVDIELGGKVVGKTIAEWIHRRRDLSEMDLKMWSMLNDKGLKEGVLKTTAGDSIPITIRRYYSPVERDSFMELYRSEPNVIDRTLEVVNAVTDVLE